MAKKKRSRLVAGQERARERARRKAHYAGPTVTPISAAPAASRIGRCRGPGLWMPTSANAEPHSGQRATKPIEALRS